MSIKDRFSYKTDHYLDRERASLGGGGSNSSSSYKPRTHPDDDPPFSRVYVLYPKEATQYELSKAFERYGNIQDIWIIRDQQKREEKGVAYIKFSKASEAARAMEEMNGKHLSDKYRDEPRLKVYVSVSRKDINRDYIPGDDIYKKMLRIFVCIDKRMNKSELKSVFQKYGEVMNTYIINDRETNQSRGLAFVTFEKASDAAKAVEEASRSFNAKFAEMPSSVRGDSLERSSRRSLEANNNTTTSSSRRSRENSYHDRFNSSSYDGNNNNGNSYSSKNGSSYESRVVDDDYVRLHSDDENIPDSSESQASSYSIKYQQHQHQYHHHGHSHNQSIFSKLPIENVCVQISDSKADRKVLILDDKKSSSSGSLLGAPSLPPPSSSSSLKYNTAKSHDNDVYMMNKKGLLLNTIYYYCQYYYYLKHI